VDDNINIPVFLPHIFYDIKKLLQTQSKNFNCFISIVIADITIIILNGFQNR